MSVIETIKLFYTHNHKKLMIIPLFLIIISFIVIGVNVSETDDILIKDISLKGGITATLLTDISIDENALEKALGGQLEEINVRKLTEFGTNKQTGVLIETSTQDEELLKSLITEYTTVQIDEENFSIELTGSSLGASFYKQMLKAMIFAFIFMSIVVFVTFRSIAPSIAVVVAAASDIIITVAVLDVFGMNVSAAGIAALLMLIGYSIDTDILLTSRVLKKSEETTMLSTFSSIKTGLTMSITSIIAVGFGALFSTAPAFKEIFTILTFGLIIDIVITYLMNAPFLLWYLERKEKKT